MRAGRLYAVGSCSDGGGFSVIDLGGDGTMPPGQSAPAGEGPWQWLTAPKPPVALIVRGTGAGDTPVPCGERLALGPDRLLVVGRTTAAGASSGTTGALLFLDARTGQVLRTVTTDADPVDVFVSSAP